MVKAKDGYRQIALLISEDEYKRIQQMRLDGEAKSATDFIRSAVSEKLARYEEDPKRSLLMQRYDALNVSGKAWLETCAKLATLDETMKD